MTDFKSPDKITSNLEINNHNYLTTQFIYEVNQHLIEKFRLRKLKC